MELKLDLHIHSAASPDGRMTTEEIIARCRAAGLNGCAVCDHDRVLREPPEREDFLVIPAVEVSTEAGHLLGLFVREEIGTRDFRAAVERIHAQGGLAVLAHPFEHRADAARRETLAALAPLLDGVEIFNSRAERKIENANALAAEFAAAHTLRPFAGSDAHVPQEIGNVTLTVEAESLTAEAVKAALLHGDVSIAGRRSLARYTAMSQLTKRRKTGASPAAYLKWALFAAKCAAQDLMRKGE